MVSVPVVDLDADRRRRDFARQPVQLATVKVALAATDAEAGSAPKTATPTTAAAATVRSVR